MSLQHIILGLLRDKPGSGYELNKRLERIGKHFWVTEQSQVYRALYKMHDAKWVAFETVVQDNNPNKKVYTITELGEQEFDRWLSETVDESLPSRVWLAQLYNAQSMSLAQAEALLRQRNAHLTRLLDWTEEQIDVLKRQVESQKQQLRLLTLEYHKLILETELNWLRQAAKRLPTIFAF